MVIQPCIINNVHVQRRNCLNALVLEYLPLFHMSGNEAAGVFFGVFFPVRLSAESIFSDAR